MSRSKSGSPHRNSNNKEKRKAGKAFTKDDPHQSYRDSKRTGHTQEAIRLNKYLSDSGICSRREADKLIESGKITVNGVRAGLGVVVQPGQIVKMGRKVIRLNEELIVLAVNKPVGIVCTEERRERNSIVRFMDYPSRITYMGRLDKDSRGLLLMTNQGDLVNQVMRASKLHEKEYKVTVDKEVTADFLKAMSEGVHITNAEDPRKLDQVTKPCTVEQVGKFTFRIVLTQGLNRQIRRMCETLGYEVKDLCRERILNIRLGHMKSGEYRRIRGSELEIFLKAIQE